jgi:hypothetical protein
MYGESPFQQDKKLDNRLSLKLVQAIQSWHRQQGHIYYKLLEE